MGGTGETRRLKLDANASSFFLKESRLGMLITAVPAYFDPPATELKRYRAEKRKEREREEQVARDILADSESTDAGREWARSTLDTRSYG